MSIDGLNVGTTPDATMAWESKNRVRMSLVLEPTINSSTDAPISRAIQPANTLPKLPVGTLNVTGCPPSASTAAT